MIVREFNFTAKNASVAKKHRRMGRGAAPNPSIQNLFQPEERKTRNKGDGYRGLNPSYGLTLSNIPSFQYSSAPTLQWLCVCEIGKTT